MLIIYNINFSEILINASQYISHQKLKENKSIVNLLRMHQNLLILIEIHEQSNISAFAIILMSKN